MPLVIGVCISFTPDLMILLDPQGTETHMHEFFPGSTELDLQRMADAWLNQQIRFYYDDRGIEVRPVESNPPEAKPLEKVPVKLPVEEVPVEEVPVRLPVEEVPVEEVPVEEVSVDIPVPSLPQPRALQYPDVIDVISNLNNWYKQNAWTLDITLQSITGSIIRGDHLTDWDLEYVKGRRLQMMDSTTREPPNIKIERSCQ